MRRGEDNIMSANIDLYKQIQDQIKEKTLFENAKTYAYEYMDTINQRPVYPDKMALNNLSQFDETLPESMGDAKDILRQLHEFGSPATVAQTGNRYFGFVNGGVTPVALAAKWLSDVWDQNAGLFIISPIASALESVCEQWLKTLFKLPDQTVAGFVSGTSTATMAGLVAARNHLLLKAGHDVQKKGLMGAPPIKIVLGEQAHSTVFKALSLIGFGTQNLSLVPMDEQGRMQSDKLPKLDSTTLIIAQAGNVNTGAFDPFIEICDIANKTGAWVHIDGAFGLWAAGSNSTSHLTAGIEKADSWSVDAHKTLNTPYDCGIVMCKNRDALVSALQNTGDYIQYGSQRDGMMYTPEMSRRARSVELWATMKFFGKAGIKALVDGLCSRAQEFAAQMAEQEFTILNEIVFNQVLVSSGDEDQTQKVLENIQSSGVCWCGGSKWNNRTVIRISICSWATTPEDIQLTVDSFVEARKKVSLKNNFT